MEIKTHPKYDLYEFNTEGQYRKIGAKVWLNGSNSHNYLSCSIRSKNIILHRAIWECFKGEIPVNYEVDHIDNNPKNNKLTNLQCITIQDNRKRRNHDFFKEISKNAHNNQRCIKSTNLDTKEEKVFKSKSQAGQYFGCSASLIYLICEKKNNAKTFAGQYIFEYTDEEPTEILEDKRIIKRNAMSEDEKLKKEQIKKEKQKICMQKYLLKKREEKMIKKTQ